MGIFQSSSTSTLSPQSAIIERDGHPYRIEIVADISDQEDKGQRFRGLELNTILVNESLRLALEEPDPDKSILRMLEYVGQALNSARAYIFELDGLQHISNTYEWCAYGVTPEKEHLQHVPKDVSELWFNEFEQDRYIVIPDINAIKDTEPLIYQYLAMQNITSAVVSPLYSDGQVTGFYGFDNPPAERVNNIYPVLKTIGHFIDTLIVRRDLNKKLEIMSYTDQMTHLGNRRAMKKRFSELDPQKSVGIAFCDVCGLKRVNDTKGHGEGDQLLLETCSCLRRVFPEYDSFRIGGDEFVVIADDIQEQDFLERCELLHTHQYMSHVPLAVGSVWNAQATETLDRLISLADARMYMDKFDYYTSSKIDPMFNAEAVDRAIANNYLSVHYQPIVQASDRNLYAMEALARWTDPVYGTLTPSIFIPALEDTRQIYRLDLYVVRESCRNLRMSIDQGRDVVPVSFNLSRLDFVECNMFDEVEKIVEEYSIPRNLLIVEITESTIIFNPVLFQEVIAQFRSAGYQVWMDDFGSGTSTLSVLKDFVFDVVKLDANFLTSSDKRSLNILESVVSLLRSANAIPLAEGVENEDQAAFLQGVGYELFQGFYFSCPCPYDEAIAAIHHDSSKD